MTTEAIFPTPQKGTPAAEPLPQQGHAPIQPFLNWLNSVEIHHSGDGRPPRTLHKTERRNVHFINGPYAEIKEFIGKVPHVEKCW